MSDSSIRVNPSIEDPSNMISPSRAFANWLEGTSTFLLAPWMSVNWRRMKRTPSALQIFWISALVNGHAPCGGLPARRPPRGRRGRKNMPESVPPIENPAQSEY